jgi:hypothetical protein
VVTPATRFAIVCLGRTGSTHLQSQLDFHSQASCFGEVFGDGKPPTFEASGLADASEFIGRLLSGAEGRAAGFKLPLNSIRRHPEAAAAFAADPEMRAIRLSRRNRLALLVSRRMLAATGVSQSIFGAYGEATVTIPPREALAAFERIAAEEDELDELVAARPAFRLDYEDLIAGRRLDELQRFLGLDVEELRSWFTKLRVRTLPETIENWDELAAALRDAGLERYLAEDG